VCRLRPRRQTQHQYSGAHAVNARGPATCSPAHSRRCRSDARSVSMASAPPAVKAKPDRSSRWPLLPGAPFELLEPVRLKGTFPASHVSHNQHMLACFQAFSRRKKHPSKTCEWREPRNAHCSTAKHSLVAGARTVEWVAHEDEGLGGNSRLRLAITTSCTSHLTHEALQLPT
jgi:hypothetical protein